jgi:hypothetical protein
MESASRRATGVWAVVALVAAVGIGLVVHSITDGSRCYPAHLLLRVHGRAAAATSTVSIAPGEDFQLVGPGGCPPGTVKTARAAVTLTYIGQINGGPVPRYGTVVGLGSATVGSTGAFTAALRLPADAPPGQIVGLLVQPYPYHPCPKNADCLPWGADADVASS